MGGEGAVEKKKEVRKESSSFIRRVKRDIERGRRLKKKVKKRGWL